MVVRVLLQRRIDSRRDLQRQIYGGGGGFATADLWGVVIDLWGVVMCDDESVMVAVC